MEKLTLLLDGDVFAFQAAILSQTAIQWDDEVCTLQGNFAEAKTRFDDRIQWITEKLKADSLIIALSDLGSGYFRRSILPSYKQNRASTMKPIMLRTMREYIIENYNTKLKPELEGDDVLGILSTHPTLVPGRKWIVSEDKDMKTLPGTFARIDRKNHAVEIMKIDESEADFWFMYQTLVGDTSDGYKGCPKVGPVKAAKILNDLAPEIAEKYSVSLPVARWCAVVDTYLKAGLTEDDALIQARVARILRHTDYDFKTKQPILWTPPVLPQKGTNAEDKTTPAVSGNAATT